MDADKNHAKFFFLASAVFAVCIGAAGVGGYAYLHSSARKSFSLFARTQKIFIVERGDGAWEVGRKLEQEGLIARTIFFVFYAWENKITGALKAGKYMVRPDMSPAHIAEMMARGEVFRDEIAVTIPEGFTAREVEKRFRDAGLFLREQKTVSDFTAGDFQAAHDFLSDAPENAGLEGYLFPDTYYIERSATIASVIDRMLKNFGKKFDADLRAAARVQGARIFDIVTMASLVQKEVITEYDMKIAAGLLWKRLAIGMPLQVDATVAYAAGRNAITREDLAVDSPYNTYRYKGLPPGPIANPGIQALRAALYSTESDYLFYLSKPNKETVFSKTLREHNIAKEKYLR